jgi:ketosteroid isomerase-like protein
MMKYILLIVVLTLQVIFPDSLSAQKNDKLRVEIETALKEWNDAAKKADPENFMALYDSGSEIILIGSDSGEIFKGEQQIRKWLTGLFANNSFEWDMKDVHIDHFENTAWVFVDGSMIVTSHNGGKNKFPYRFTGILIKQNNKWKWRLFNGSVPQGE